MIHQLFGNYCSAATRMSHCNSLYIIQIQAHQDPFLRSMAYWVLEDYSRALDTLLEQPANSVSAGRSAVLFRLCVFRFLFPFLYK